MSKVVDRVGETRKAKNGMQMTIIAYRNANDIDIQFEDGVIVNHKRYQSFMSGSIKHPALNCHSCQGSKKHLGETSKATNGMMMKIIDYRTSKDFDVEFEDGTKVRHCRYTSFKKGTIKYPVEYIGKTAYANNGMEMQIIKCDDSRHVTVRFADGCIVSGIRLVEFYSGEVVNPNIQYTNGFLKFPYIVGGFKLEGKAYKYQNNKNYFCTCRYCGHKDIMTIQEMKEHICNI